VRSASATFLRYAASILQVIARREAPERFPAKIRLGALAIALCEHGQFRCGPASSSTPLVDGTVKMATVKTMNSTDTEDIQRRMAQIRHEMHEDVRGAVQGAQSLTDWRSAVKSRPWLSVGIAFVAGYLVVPRRRTTLAPVVTVAGLSPGHAVAVPDSATVSGTRGRTRNTLGIVFSLVAPVLVRAAQSYVAQHLEEWLAAHPVRLAGGRSQGSPADEGARPGGPPFSAPRFRQP
jgi:hypothetical protein